MAIRVAILCEYPTLLGGERSLLGSLPHLLDAGVAVQAIAPRGKLQAAFEDLGVAVSCWTAGRGISERKDDRLADRELVEIVGRLRPDVVHANSLAMSRLLGRVSDHLRVPCLGHLRDIVRQSRAAIDGLNRNARVLAVSKAVKDYHCAAGLDPAKTHVLFNGVDLGHFSPGSATGWLHTELRLPKDVHLVGAIGQVSLRKGWDVILDAARMLLHRRSDVAFVLVGACYSDKPETREVERQLIEACREFAGRIFWLGERDDVANILSELSILAHAARQEPLGRVLIEAAAAGRAIVATDVGGTSEIFPPSHRAARLVAANDAAALTDAISELLSNESERKRLEIAARQRAIQAFDVRTAAEELLRHYREVAAMAK